MIAIASETMVQMATGPIGIVVKATIVLACAALMVLGLRSASAAVRHLVWLLGLVSCVGLALAAPAAPRIDVPVSRRAVALFTPSVPEHRDAFAEARTRIDIPIVLGVERPGRTRGQPIEVWIPRGSLPTRQSVLSTEIGNVLPELLIAAWFAGVVLVLMRSVIGHRRVAAVIDGAQRLSSDEWIAAVLDASSDVGLTRSIELLETNAVSSPITFGFVRPVVILPIEAKHWDAERRHIVLVHELAHVRRFDYVAQLIATVACALFWFHPAVWLAAARLRAEAEHAADDRVLNAGTVGVNYATHLLELARGERSPSLSPAVAIGMIRSSHLEGRFRAMLDSTRSRAAVSPRLQAAATSLALCAMIPAAGARPIARQASTARPHLAEALIEARAAAAIAGPIRVHTERRATSIVIQERSSQTMIVDSLFEKTIDASPGDRLSLDLQTGGAIVLHGWDQPRIRVMGRLSGRDWRDTRVSLERAGDRVRLRSEMTAATGEWSTSHQFEIWVPRHINVDISSAGGSLAINDLDGEFYGHTGGGGITIQGATGRATLSTGGGAVTVTNSNLSGSVSTGGGEVTIANVTGGLRGTSGSGVVSVANADGTATTIRSGGGAGFGSGASSGGGGGDIGTTRGGFGGTRVRTGTTTTTTIGSGGVVTTNYPDGFATTTIGGQGFGRAYGGSLSISKAGGEIIIDSAPEGGVLHTGGGRIVVGSSERGISATTGGGDIELEHVGGNASVSTGAGDVRVSVVNTNGNVHSVDVSSGKGRVVIELPADLDARVELESAYTENFDRKTKITSDFSLEHSETDQWDDRFGTPRRFVRATGTFGSGRGLVRVRTVNGDVVVRRVSR